MKKQTKATNRTKPTKQMKFKAPDLNSAEQRFKERALAGANVLLIYTTKQYSDSESLLHFPYIPRVGEWITQDRIDGKERGNEAIYHRVEAVIYDCECSQQVVQIRTCRYDTDGLYDVLRQESSAHYYAIEKWKQDRHARANAALAKKEAAEIESIRDAKKTTQQEGTESTFSV